MFSPQFVFTMKMVNNLGHIERLYGQITTEQLIPSLAVKLSSDNQILATHHSTSIEGNPLSPRDVTNIILGDQVPTTKSEREVKNYFAVLLRLMLLTKKHVPITTELTQELHGVLLEGIDKRDIGHFRDGGVFVGHRTATEIVVKHNPPFHTREEIKKALDERFKWLMKEDELHPVIKAGILHHQFAYIHPFFDGNGRLSRILTTYYLMLQRYEVTKYFIMDDYYDMDRTTYSDSLHSADTGDETEWLEYFLEGITFSLQAAQSRIDKLKNKNYEEITGEKRVLVTKREEEVLQIILDKKAVKSEDIKDALEVTRQQAHALLASLVRKGLLEKHGITKTSYYKLNSSRTS
jgi:Fic family protein